MTYLSDRSDIRILLFISSCAALSCSASDDMNKYPTLTMHGESYANACAPEQKKGLQDAVLASTVQDAAQAWLAVDAILCAPNNNVNRKHVENLVPQKVRETVQSTGEKPTSKMVPRSDELVTSLIAGGKAWRARIRTEPSKVVLLYFADEACVKDRRLNYINFKWSVYEVGESCD
jgi:hypothetical protein